MGPPKVVVCTTDKLVCVPTTIKSWDDVKTAIAVLHARFNDPKFPTFISPDVALEEAKALRLVITYFGKEALLGKTWKPAMKFDEQVKLLQEFLVGLGYKDIYIQSSKSPSDPTLESKPGFFGKETAEALFAFTKSLQGIDPKFANPLLKAGYNPEKVADLYTDAWVLFDTPKDKAKFLDFLVKNAKDLAALESAAIVERFRGPPKEEAKGVQALVLPPTDSKAIRTGVLDDVAQEEKRIVAELARKKKLADDKIKGARSAVETLPRDNSLRNLLEIELSQLNGMILDADKAIKERKYADASSTYMAIIEGATSVNGVIYSIIQRANAEREKLALAAKEPEIPELEPLVAEKATVVTPIAVASTLSATREIKKLEKRLAEIEGLGYDVSDLKVRLEAAKKQRDAKKPDWKALGAALASISTECDKMIAVAKVKADLARTEAEKAVATVSDASAKAALDKSLARAKAAYDTTGYLSAITIYNGITKGVGVWKQIADLEAELQLKKKGGYEKTGDIETGLVALKQKFIAEGWGDATLAGIEQVRGLIAALKKPEKKPEVIIARPELVRKPPVVEAEVEYKLASFTVGIEPVSVVPGKLVRTTAILSATGEAAIRSILLSEDTYFMYSIVKENEGMLYVALPDTYTKVDGQNIRFAARLKDDQILVYIKDGQLIDAEQAEKQGIRPTVAGTFDYKAPPFAGSVAITLNITAQAYRDYLVGAQTGPPILLNTEAVDEKDRKRELTFGAAPHVRAGIGDKFYIVNVSSDCPPVVTEKKKKPEDKK